MRKTYWKRPGSLLLLTACAAAVEGQTRTVAIDAGNSLGPHSRVPLRMVGAGRANEGLRADWQKQLAQVQQEIGFDYIRMHGILNDEMGVYTEDAQGAPQYNFQYVDTLYDALLAMHIRPFVEFAFMPAKLASGSKTIFWWKGNITPPKDSAKWAGLIGAFVQHMQARYGEDEVRQWYFEVWNEPDLKDGFWAGTLDDYLALYKTTAEAVKSACAACRVGGPASASPYKFEEAFEKYVVDNKIPADFVSTHAYGVTQGFLDAGGTSGTVLDPSPNAVSGRMQHSRELLQQSGRPGMQLHFTEWSSAYTATDPIHDQYHQASFVLDKIKRATPFVDSMSYWTFTDIFEENGPPSRPFHGGFGMMNLEGIRKPSYFAYKFLSSLKGVDLGSSDAQSWATRSPDGSIEILVWDYSPVVPPKGQTDQSFYKQELPTVAKGTVRVEIAGLKGARYKVTTSMTGYQHNDAYTAYLRLGAPSQLSVAQVKLLDAASSGAPESVKQVTARGGKVEIELPLRANDVYLLELTPQ